MTGKLLALFALWLFATGAAARNSEEMRPVKIADGVYMFENTSGTSNATVVITDEGVLVFDFNILTADQVAAGIKKLTNKKVRYLISSHSALDHASGAWYYREDGPTYIATKNQIHDLQMQEAAGFNERKESKDPRNAAYKGKELVKPDIGFDGNMTLYFGGLTFQITAEGRGHSTGDLTVYIPQKRLFLMGDLLDTEVHPGQGESGDIFFSNVKGWIEILDRIMARQLPVDTYVPGHGPVHVGRGVKDLEEQKRYFVVMRDEVAKMVVAGKSLDQIEKEVKVPQEFAHYKRTDRLKPFLKLYYHQLMETGY
jgi:glyoxylase-like metal-dependent hydrolase (beta-lactamase superfamily II)